MPSTEIVYREQTFVGLLLNYFQNVDLSCNIARKILFPVRYLVPHLKKKKRCDPINLRVPEVNGVPGKKAEVIVDLLGVLDGSPLGTVLVSEGDYNKIPNRVASRKRNSLSVLEVRSLKLRYWELVPSALLGLTRTLWPSWVCRHIRLSVPGILLVCLCRFLQFL